MKKDIPGKLDQWR